MELGQKLRYSYLFNCQEFCPKMRKIYKIKNIQIENKKVYGIGAKFLTI